MGAGKRLAWAIAGTVAARIVRRSTRRALHTGTGETRLPRWARVRRGFGTTLAFAAGAGAVLGLADVLSEQGRNASSDE
jgi:hypothetical protein